MKETIMFERIEKMDRRTVAAMAIAVVVGLVLFGLITSGIRQAGWNEGFLMGQLSSGAQVSAEGGAPAVNPYLAGRGYNMHGWGGSPFWIIGGFFRFLFFGFLIMLFFKFFAARRWACHGRYAGGHAHGPWRAQGEPAERATPNTAQEERTADNSNQPQQTSWTQL